MFKAALFTIAKTWKPLKCPSIDEWIKKMSHIHTHTHTHTHTLEYYCYFLKKKKQNFATCSNIGRLGGQIKTSTV